MGIKVICQNKKATQEYTIEEKYEAGISLKGDEVKSLRAGRANINDSYVRITGGEAFLINTHISPYEKADGFGQNEPRRPRKLLLHKREIKRLAGKTEQRGYTLIPLKLYFKNGKAKVEIALAKGKKLHDRREALKRKTVDKEMERAVKMRLRRG
ncbi:MAG TPA: SsrA-binding protein SmpB [Deltaproteobacteria bacterium]|nr:SsrA-binding protein SmpB [Deltaproteobacteria bacterium]